MNTEQVKTDGANEAGGKLNPDAGLESHTATPWSTENGRIYDAEEYLVADCLDTSVTRPNAAFIVRACNAHEDLVDLLYRALPFVEDAENNDGYKDGAVKKFVAEIRIKLKSLEA